MDEILSVNGLTKKYPKFTLDHVGFNVKKNNIVGFIGPNGAGKTTTIKLILGLIHQDAGNIKYFDTESDKLNFNDVKNRIGVVLDDACFYDEFTIDNMKSIIAPAYSNWDDKIYKEYIERFHLNPKQKISSLSKGMKVKFSLALALSHNAELLIMDEPSSGLDPIIRKQLNEILLEYVHKDNNSIFYSTHITSDLDKIADTLVCIDHGKIQFFEKKSDILSKYIYFSGEIKNMDKTKVNSLPLYVENEGEFYALSEKEGIIQNPNFKYRKPNIEEVMMCFVKREVQQIW